MSNSSSSNSSSNSPVSNALGPIAVLVTLLHRAQERGSQYLESQVERIAAEVLFFEQPPRPDRKSVV